jgi:hypothetical protein
MNTVHRQRGQVLILIFGAMFLGGGLAAGVFSSGTALKYMKKRNRPWIFSKAGRTP